MAVLLRHSYFKLLGLNRSVASSFVGFRRISEDYRPDYYSALGLSRAADTKQIKLAYFRMAKKYHPDNNQSPDAKFMFHFVAEAYEVLTDDEKRKNYDIFGTPATTTGGQSKGPQRPYYHQNYNAEELYSKIFKEAAEQGPNFKINDSYNDETCFGFDSCHEFVVDLTFEQAALGVNYEIPLNMKVICYKCDGSRNEMGYQGNICPYCEGTGIETIKVGHVLTRRTCAYCDGSKIFIKYKCLECHGTGVTILMVEHKVQIPPGCEHGQLLRIQIPDKFMEFAAPDQADHYFLKIVIDPSNYFKREGLDVITEADVSVAQALLGGQLQIRGLTHDKAKLIMAKKFANMCAWNPKTIRGVVTVAYAFLLTNVNEVILRTDAAATILSKLKIRIPTEGVSSHQILVAPGEGILRHDRLGSGDHFVKVGIGVPKPEVMTRRQRELIRLFSLLESPPENGLVDNGVEADDGHRYRVNVVEASNVQRIFNVVTKTEKEKFDEEQFQGKDESVRVHK